MTFRYIVIVENRVPIEGEPPGQVYGEVECTDKATAERVAYYMAERAEQQMTGYRALVCTPRGMRA